MCTLNFRTTFGHLDLTTAQPHHLSMIMLKVKLAAVAVAPSGPAGGSFLVWGVFSSPSGKMNLWSSHKDSPEKLTGLNVREE